MSRYINGKLNLDMFNFDKDDVEYTNYIIEPYDRFDIISTKFYNTSKYWYILCLFNEILDPFIKEADWGKTIKIPKDINFIEQKLDYKK